MKGQGIAQDFPWMGSQSITGLLPPFGFPSLSTSIKKVVFFLCALKVSNKCFFSGRLRHAEKLSWS